MVTRVRRLFTMITGQAITELEASHPLAVLDYERNHLRTQVAQYNRSLASHAALCERLRAQGVRLEKEQTNLGKRVEQRLAAGDREAAARWALRLEHVQEDRQENGAQLVQAEETYQGLVRSRDVAVEAARAKIEGLKRSIGEVRVQQALADLTEMAASIQGSIGVCDGTLERVHERLEEKREFAVGRVRVAQDTICLDSIDIDEDAQAALAEEALQRFEAAHGPTAEDDPGPGRADPAAQDGEVGAPEGTR